MRILYVCHRFPFPPIRGGKIRPFNMIRHLSGRHEVTVASLVRSAEEAEAGRGLADHCHRYIMEPISSTAAWARMIARLPTAVPSSMGYFYAPRLAARVREALSAEGFDLIFVHCSSVAQYVDGVVGIPKILDFGDMDSQKWLAYAKVRRPPLSMGYWLEGTKMERAEKMLARKFDLCTCTTKAELATLDGFGAARHTGWFPNGVDTDTFRPSDDPYRPDSLCFIGRMDYYPNQEGMLDFCANVLPLIREKRPDVTLTIVGADPSEEIRDLGKLPGVAVTGTVPEVRPYVVASAVNVAPLNIARGTQNKILESMAMGVPVVASEKAADGIDAMAGEHFLTATTPAQYAETIIRLLEDPEERQRYAAAGRARVMDHHSWAASMTKMEGLIAECVDRANPPGGR